MQWNIENSYDYLLSNMYKGINFGIKSSKGVDMPLHKINETKQKRLTENSTI